MTVQITYTQARAKLASLLDRVTKNRDIVVIQRRGKDDVALIPADELESLLETAYLLRSPVNAERLLSAVGRAMKEEGEKYTLADLRREVGFDQGNA